IGRAERPDRSGGESGMSAAGRLVSLRILLFIAGIAVAVVFANGASAFAFSAHGSAEQVYATDLPAGAGISLLDSGGGVVATRNANQLGGTLFRNVQPGDGYRVVSGGEESAPLKVLTTQSAPPDTSIYD